MGIHSGNADLLIQLVVTMVYILDINNKPLMPTERHGHVRKLLRDGKACVIRRTPFTIRLNYETTSYVQKVNLGIDAGTKHIGVSATTSQKELFASEVILRSDITDLLSTRREQRRTRRNRLRYRKPRFVNRKRPEDWLAPSVQNCVDAHLRVISKVHKLLPVSKTTIEVAQFDAQKIKDSSISGEEYQQGEQMGFWNVREYVLARDGHKCQHCHGKSKDPILNVHHLESRKTGGNAPNNLITLCETCHKDYHKGKIELKIKRGTSLRDAAVMNIMRWAVYNQARKEFPDVHLTYGYITKNTRIRTGLQKTHAVDARCISGNPTSEALGYYFLQKQIRRHNRQIHKANLLKGGRKKLNQAPYLVKGFRLFDKVLYNGIECFVFGRRASGSFDIRKLDGTKVHVGIGYKKLVLLEKRKNFLISKEGTGAIPPMPEDLGILAHK